MRALRTLAISAALAPLAFAQSTPPQPAEDVYKNIQALKGTPSDQLGASMQFISASLGVDCSFCHNTDKYDSDEKRPKQTARQMISMTLDINKASFNGRLQITCYSCHRGSQRPVNTPPVLEIRCSSPAPPGARGRGGQPPGPTANQILDRYIAASAEGSAALQKVTTRIQSRRPDRERQRNPHRRLFQALPTSVSITSPIRNRPIVTRASMEFSSRG